MTQQDKIDKLENDVVLLEAELDELRSQTDFLNCLYACGVDSWEGFGEAQEMYAEECGDFDDE